MNRIWGPSSNDPPPPKKKDDKDSHFPKIKALPIKGRKPKHAKKKGDK